LNGDVHRREISRRGRAKVVAKGAESRILTTQQIFEEASRHGPELDEQKLAAELTSVRLQTRAAAATISSRCVIFPLMESLAPGRACGHLDGISSSG